MSRKQVNEVVPFYLQLHVFMLAISQNVDGHMHPIESNADRINSNRSLNCPLMLAWFTLFFATHMEACLLYAGIAGESHPLFSHILQM